ncbi:hypothetical protein [Vibrio phage JSF13]|jgi:hypothetical protein|uniref:Uncharacterized protein ORF11 n=1 Tax=Vibrio phage ICP1 TaxID=979525 RepID=F1D133_9CAUD|nr:hypothetical protein ViPhICP1_gp011 [Vibrio phage ICP1]ADX88056.1 hypothetical protein TUST1-191_00050 [Vibrio phage ICP1_2006_D]ADX88283.1 hypothetical protein TUST1-182_00050 [Vibrio phage ICP1_2006_C]ADX88510.1 hypothetical protein TUST1-159_00050 [Vibrio phage ICP1_2006_B]ADX88736.1 hypothetical protein TUST1-17_00050 [Vibrio phage ICP1_2006_A]ADX88962.1 hypothetical protein TUST1-15_00050 [Vibrio phage ICP1_2005_A]ADX89192.1 hypothetical protein TUST1-2_00050 [Vibrio phage ICP1_2001_A
MDFQQITQNETFQQYILLEALKLLSKDTGINIECLIEQFPNNAKLREECAKIAVETAKILATK